MKTIATAFISLCVLILLNENCLAQPKNEISVYAGFVQLKEGLNQSMVYNGPQIGFHYQRNRFFDNWELHYKPKIALGVPFNRGMYAVNINFSPVDFSGIRTVYQKDNHKFKLGLNFATNYSYQSYPNQRNGAHLSWLSEIGIAPCFKYDYQWKQSKIKIFLQNSIAGFISRTKEIPPYFYSFKFADFFTKPHQNMQFGSFDKYEHLNASIEYIPKISTKHSFAFGVEYIDSYFSNRFQSLNYYLQWKKSF
ncbi:MAG: hypothetical protein LBB53_05625 [Prevotellaceae bacterium]|jgi:hypothetical protein|nr:hypothetical protein [Prevotellaceae bacterium]